MTPEQQERVLKNLPLVSLHLKHILSGMSKKPTFLEWDDLEQAGREGLIKAVLEEVTKPNDVRWTTFAGWNIKGAIRDAFEGSADKAGERQVRLPHRIHVALNAITRVINELTQKLEREPYPEELAAHFDLSVNTILQLRKWSSQSPESYDWVGEDRDGNTAADLGQSVFAQQEDEITDPIVMSTLKEVLNSPMLSRREVKIMFRSLVGDESFEEIGDDLNVSRQRVQQIQARALKKVQQDSRMRRQDDENLFVPNMRTAHMYRFANQDRSDDEWLEENTVKLEWTEERRRQWYYGSIRRPTLGFRL